MIRTVNAYTRTPYEKESVELRMGTLAVGGGGSITMNKVVEVMEFQLSYLKSLKIMLLIKSALKMPVNLKN